MHVIYSYHCLKLQGILNVCQCFRPKISKSKCMSFPPFFEAWESSIAEIVILNLYHVNYNVSKFLCKYLLEKQGQCMYISNQNIHLPAAASGQLSNIWPIPFRSFYRDLSLKLITSELDASIENLKCYFLKRPMFIGRKIKFV